MKSEKLTDTKLVISHSVPGLPVDLSICLVCRRGVEDGEEGLMCDNCCIWFHSSCQNVSDARYNELKVNPNEGWKCNSCQKQYDDLNSDIRWGSATGHTQISAAIDEVFAEISSWHKNAFLVPRGKVGNEFLIEFTRLLNLFNYKTSFEQHAISLALIFVALVTQKPSRNSKAKTNSEYLAKRLKLWKDQDIPALLREGREIQNRLKKQISGDRESASRAFTRLMMQGKVSQAMRFISESSNIKGVYDANKEVIEKLREKHPKAQIPEPDILCNEEYIAPEPVIFETIDANLVKIAAKEIQGSGGPSKIDADFFKHILCTKFYKNHSVNLCQAIADLTKRLATEKIEPQHLRHFISGRLIPLKKEDSDEIKIRPIGIGEILRRITGKCMVKTLKLDLQDATGILQTCNGVSSGIEAAVHAMRRTFNDDSCEAILLVDASNAFNSLNRAAAIHNLQHLCPPFYQYIHNTYQCPADLVINNTNNNGEDGHITSEEGVTQGDVCAMALYGVSTKPIIQKLHEDTDSDRCRQCWYADDASVAGHMEEMKKWWDTILNIGPKYGYLPNENKTVLIVKDLEGLIKAQEVFRGTGIEITTTGDRHLGAVIGSPEFRELYVNKKVSGWIKDLRVMVEIAKDEPQAAYAGFTRGLCHRWSYLQRTIPDISHCFEPLEKVIKDEFIPTLVGRPISDHEREIFELPVRYGGLGISNPVRTADSEFKNSIYVTEKLTGQIYEQDITSRPDLRDISARKKHVDERKEWEHRHRYKELRNSPKTSQYMQRLLDLACEKGAGAWLTALPIQALGYSFNKEDVVGSIKLRYGFKISKMPIYCGCGKKNSIDHAITCPKGGYVIFRHNKVRDTFAKILKEVCTDVKTEPCLIPIEADFNSDIAGNKSDGARLDVSCVGIWSPLERTLMDVRIFHPCSPSYMTKSVDRLYADNENSKKRAYNARVINVEKATFVPLVFSTHGGMGQECRTVLKRIATKIADKRGERYSSIINHLTTRLRFTLLRSVLLMLRGTRGARVNDGKALESICFNMIPE